MPKFYQSKPWLFARFVIQKKTVAEMAEEAGCTAQTIYLYLRKYDLM